MAIGGGGGGGILGFSNSFTGTATAIEIAGDFAYAYSGPVRPVSGDETKTALEFTTGNYLFVSQTQLTGRTAGMAANKELGLIISLNDNIFLGFTDPPYKTNGFFTL